MYKKSDEQLVGEVQTGIVSSYEQLVRRFERKLFFYALRIVRHEDDAKDAVQEAFIHVYEHIERFDRSRSFSAYVYSITHNEAITIIRKRKHTESLDTVSVAGDVLSPIDKIIAQASREEIARAVDSLEPKYRDVVRLYYFDDLSYEEIAQTLHIPINTVRTNLKRGKMRLKDRIHHETH
jgi:RNA polymerase sigma factor (sigma-70 family)